MTRITEKLGGVILTAMIVLFSTPDVRTQNKTQIHFRDQREEAGINFVHYAPRPRWCEIGPTVQGAATNEGLERVFREQKELWKSGNRLLTLEEFAHVHLIKMNGSGAAWLDYDRGRGDGAVDLSGQLHDATGRRRLLAGWN